MLVIINIHQSMRGNFDKKCLIGNIKRIKLNKCKRLIKTNLFLCIIIIEHVPKNIECWEIKSVCANYWACLKELLDMYAFIAC